MSRGCRYREVATKIRNKVQSANLMALLTFGPSRQSVSGPGFGFGGFVPVLVVPEGKLSAL